MKSGMITLLDWNEKKLDAHSYRTELERKKIIESWRKRYGHNIVYCYFQVRPNVTVKTDSLTREYNEGQPRL